MMQVILICFWAIICGYDLMNGNIEKGLVDLAMLNIAFINRRLDNLESKQETK